MSGFGADVFVKLAIGYVVFSFIANIVGGIAIIVLLLNGGLCG